MTRSMRYVGWMAGLVALAGLVACEQGNKRDNSTTPPKAHSDVTPKVNATTYVAHGELLERRGELERAAEQYRQALELSPDLVVAHNRLGVTLNRLGRHAEATAEFRKAVALRPEEAYLQNNLGFSLYLEKRYDEAEPIIARALTLQPAFQRAHMNHGLVLGRLGRYDEAFTEFAQAGPEADAHYNVAVMQVEAGHYAEAARALEQAIQCDPNFAMARDELREVSRLAAAEENKAKTAAPVLAESEGQQKAAPPAEPAPRATAVPAEASQLAADESPLETKPDAQLAAAVSTPTGSGAVTGGTEMTGAPPARAAVTEAKPDVGRALKGRPSARVATPPAPAAGAPAADKTTVKQHGHTLTPRTPGGPRPPRPQPPMSLAHFARGSRYLRVFEQIRPVLAASDDNTPIDTTRFGGGTPQELRAKFNELSLAVGSSAPNADLLLREWEERLGLSGPVGLDNK
jgi:Flp pilus assembly protein TadD